MSACRRFVGKVAIVTGSTHGIGFEVAKRFAEEGAKVVVCSRRQQNVDDAVKRLHDADLDAHGLVCHVGNQEHRDRLIDETLQKYKRIDVLVNTAGVNPHSGNLLDITPDAWDKTFEINVKSPFFLSQAVIPHMKHGGGGSVIFVSSRSAYNAFGVTGAYSFSKLTLHGMVKAMAYDFSQLNVRVNCVAYGLFKTEFGRAAWSNPQVYNNYVPNLPMKRMGRVDECPGVVAFLASDQDASYITGETILVAGGDNCRS